MLEKVVELLHVVVISDDNAYVHLRISLKIGAFLYKMVVYIYTLNFYDVFVCYTLFSC